LRIIGDKTIVTEARQSLGARHPPPRTPQRRDKEATKVREVMSPSIKTNRKAVYTGSFDPLTFGHLDIIERGMSLFHELIVGVGNNPHKHYLFTLDERLSMCRAYLTKKYPGLKIEAFEGLLVDFAKKHACKSIVRGLRVNTDFEFEYQLGLTNMNIDKSVETIFLLARPQNIFVSASMVKEIASYGGDVGSYVPEVIAKQLKEKLSNR
jgi:pantetheine-phosphate adenylyltransferase